MGFRKRLGFGVELEHREPRDVHPSVPRYWYMFVSINGEWTMVPALQLCPLEGGEPIQGVLCGLSQVDRGTGRSFNGDGSQAHGCHSDSVWGHGCVRSCITGASKDWSGEVDRGYPPTRGA